MEIAPRNLFTTIYCNPNSNKQYVSRLGLVVRVSDSFDFCSKPVLSRMQVDVVCKCEWQLKLKYGSVIRKQVYIEYIEWSLLVFETSLRLLWDFEFSRLPWSVLRSRLAWRSHSASTYSDLDQAPRHDANRLPQVAPRTVKSAKCACKCEFELYSLLRSSPSHGLVADTLFPNYSKLTLAKADWAEAMHSSPCGRSQLNILNANKIALWAAPWGDSDKSTRSPLLI